MLVIYLSSPFYRKLKKYLHWVWTKYQYKVNSAKEILSYIYTCLYRDLVTLISSLPFRQTVFQRVTHMTHKYTEIMCFWHETMTGGKLINMYHIRAAFDCDSWVCMILIMIKHVSISKFIDSVMYSPNC